MPNKIFLVVTTPKNQVDVTSTDCQFNYFDDYSQAFDSFNERLATEASQLFKQPAREQPLFAALQNNNIELWIVNRSNEPI